METKYIQRKYTYKKSIYIKWELTKRKDIWVIGTNRKKTYEKDIFIEKHI